MSQGETCGDRDQGVPISTLGWILVVAAAWLVVATIVGVLVGRMIRERDRQVPPPPGTAPAPKAETEDDPTQQVPGRRRQPGS